MHGIGYSINANGEKRKSLYKSNFRICYMDEAIPFTRISLVWGNEKRKYEGTICDIKGEGDKLRHFVRLDNGIEQWISLLVENFQLLRTQPKIHPPLQPDD